MVFNWLLMFFKKKFIFWKRMYKMLKTIDFEINSMKTSNNEILWSTSTLVNIHMTRCHAIDLLSCSVCGTYYWLFMLFQRFPPLIARFVPFTAVASANCINVPCMRMRYVVNSLQVWLFYNWNTGRLCVR